MVVDNADSTDVLFGLRNRDTTSQPDAQQSISTRSVSTYLPCSENGSIVVTSRSREVMEGLLEYPEDILPVEPMTVEEAAVLLLKKLKPENHTVQRDDLTRLVRELDCMPLAITQAASCINQRAPRMSVSQYLEDLIRSDVERTALLEPAIRDPRRDEQASNSIILTWHISFEHLRQTRESAARLLALMCLFDRETIPEDLLIGRYLVDDGDDNFNGMDQAQLTCRFQHDVTTLRAYDLVRVGLNTQAFDMHRLVQFATRRWLELHGELVQWQTKFAALLCNVFPNGKYENWVLCQALLPHVESLMSYRVDNDNFNRDCANVAHRRASYIRQMGKYDAAESIAYSNLVSRKQLYPPGSPEIMYSMTLLAGVLTDQGKYEEAEQLLRQALEGFETALGLDHPDTLANINELALVLQYRGRYKHAEELFRQALAGMEKELRVNHPNTLATMSNRGLVLLNQGRYKQAEELFRRVLAIEDRELTVNHPQTLQTMSNLAMTLRDQRKCKQAEELCRQALAGREKELRVNHPDTLTSMSYLAMILNDQGQYDQAEELHQQVLAIQEEQLGATHPGTLISVWFLATMYHSRQDYNKALSLYGRAADGFAELLGPTHPRTQEGLRRKQLMLDSIDGRRKEINALD